MERLPPCAALVVKDAVPLKSGALPREVPLSKNCTMPLGAPAPGLFTVTVVVNVTNWVKTEGLVELWTVPVVVSALLTVCTKGLLLLLLELKLLSPT